MADSTSFQEINVVCVYFVRQPWIHIFLYMPLLLYEKHKLDSLKVSEYSDTSLISLKNIFAVNFYKGSGTGTSPVVMVPFD